MGIAYLAIGSNIGDRERNCAEALKKLSEISGIKINKKSSFYETGPEDGPPQGDYINGVIEISTDIPPLDLLAQIKHLEKDMGRKDKPRNFPRIIDIDILLYDDIILNSEKLIIPHLRMHKRKFVLKGFSELAPEVLHPVLGETIGELYKAL